MGNNRSNQQYIVTTRHPKLGEVVPKQRFGRRQIVCTKIVPPSIMPSEWQEELSQISIGCRKDFLFLPSSYNFGRVQGLCCTQQSKCELVYENYEFLLDMELQNRRLQRRLYSGPELWYMFYNILEAVKEFEVRGLKIGDVRPKNILLNSLGKLKLINRYSWPGEESGLEKMASKTDTYCYLAPEQLKALKYFGGSLPLQNRKTDAFSIGVTMIEIASLNSAQEFYDWKNLQFLEEPCNRAKFQISTIYGTYFYNFLNQLTQVDPRNRPSCGEAWATLSPYALSINKLQPFTIDKVPSQRALQEFIRKQQKGTL